MLKPGGKHVLAVDLAPEVSIVLSIIPHLKSELVTGLTFRQHLYQVAKDGSEVCPLNGVDAHDLLVGRPDQACCVNLRTDMIKIYHQVLESRIS